MAIMLTGAKTLLAMLVRPHPEPPLDLERQLAIPPELWAKAMYPASPLEPQVALAIRSLRLERMLEIPWRGWVTTLLDTSQASESEVPSLASAKVRPLVTLSDPRMS